MRLKVILLLLLGAFFAIALLVAATLFWMADPLNLRAPSDKKLLEVFRDYRPDLERLRVMAEEDSSKLSYFSAATLSSSGLNESRINDYTRLLSRVYPGLVETYAGHDLVRFNFACGGIMSIGPGWLKGIQYLPDAPDRYGILVPSLDDKRKAAPRVYLRHIESHWYLFYQLDD